jgi:hypothetical protein
LTAISHVFTITYVAKMLGEDEDWLHERSITMFPEDGRVYVCTGSDDTVTAFTDYGIECLKQIIADQRAGRLTVPVQRIKHSDGLRPKGYAASLAAANNNWT